MALFKTNANVIAYKLESTFNEVLTFVDADVVPYTSASWKPETDVIERDNVNSTTLLKLAPLQGKQSSTGDVSVELVADSASGVKLTGSALYEAALGAYDAAGATIGATSITDNTAASDGDAGTYYLSDASDPLKSLGSKYYIGGDKDNGIDIRGILVESMKINFPSQGIVTTDFSLKGSSGFIPVATATALVESCSSKIPYVAKSMTFEVGGVALCATDLEVTVSNSLAEFSCITGTGNDAQDIVERTIEGTFTIAFSDLTEINAYNSFSTGSIYAKAISPDGNEFAIHLPKIQRTSLDINDDNGIVTQQVSFNVVQDCTVGVRPIMIATK